MWKVNTYLPACELIPIGTWLHPTRETIDDYSLGGWYKLLNKYPKDYISHRDCSYHKLKYFEISRGGFYPENFIEIDCNKCLYYKD